jgi:EAL and modified HD-GYP domain-containing signal transduction protein
VSYEQAAAAGDGLMVRDTRRSDAVYVGRQAIYDVENEVFGYEISFRDLDADMSSPEDVERATSQVLVTTFLDIGVERLVGEHPAFVQVTRPFLTGLLPVPSPPELVVLEIGPEVAGDVALLKAVGRFAAEGFRIATDFETFRAGGGALLRLADFVKVDMSSAPVGELPSYARAIRASGALPVAVNVGDEDALAAATRAGFALFVGPLFARPQLVGGPGLSPSRLSCVRLLGAMLADEFDLDELEDVLRTDPALAYRVLRLANSAGVGLRGHVTSVRQALVLVGPESLRGWLVVMALADMGATDTDRLSWALTRARMCELLTEHVPGVKADQAFLAGLLSALVELLGTDVAELAAHVGATPELSAALISGSGPIGVVLGAVVQYEAGGGGLEVIGPVDVVTARRAYLAAMAWSLQLSTVAMGHIDA